MRFYCGPSFAERSANRSDAKKRRLGQWHPFFCLMPRRIGQQCVWLENIRRKGHYQDHGYNASEWIFEYRLSLEAEMTAAQRTGEPRG